MGGRCWAATQIPHLGPALPRSARWELYEQGQPHKISQGSADYFQCTNKGCDTSKPLSLYLERPHSVPTSFKIEFTDVIPSPSTSGDYTLVVWGYGAARTPGLRWHPPAANALPRAAALPSTHFAQTKTTSPTTSRPPSGTPRPPPLASAASHHRAPAPRLPSFNATSSAAAAPAVAAQPAAPTPATESNARYTWRAENGNFTVALVNMYTASGAWKVGETAHVVVRGEIPSKRISAGTVKYQVWENYVEHFVAQGNSPYFHCSNKGCDVTQPVALDMRYPASRPTGYQLRFDFPIPQPEKTGEYRVVVWGEDQDHTPYDFSLTLGFNTTSPLLF